MRGLNDRQRRFVDMFARTMGSVLLVLSAGCGDLPTQPVTCRVDVWMAVGGGIDSLTYSPPHCIRVTT